MKTRTCSGRIFLVGCLGLALAEGRGAAASSLGSYGTPEKSRYEAQVLPVFEIAQSKGESSAAGRVSATMKALLGPERISVADEGALVREASRGNRTWSGSLQAAPEITYEVDLDNGRLQVVDHSVRNKPIDPSALEMVSRETAVSSALRVIESLGVARVFDPAEYDLKDLEIVNQKLGMIERGQAPDLTAERIVDYRVLVKRKFNGVPVFGEGVVVVIRSTGELQEIGISGRSINATMLGGERTPVGGGSMVPVDRTPEAAQREFESALHVGPRETLRIERWGLGYLSTATGGQRYYQPAYVFVASVQSEAGEGFVSNGKIVRAVAASKTVLEPIPSDPLATAQPPEDPGDPRKPAATVRQHDGDPPM